MKRVLLVVALVLAGVATALAAVTTPGSDIPLISGGNRLSLDYQYGLDLGAHGNLIGFNPGVTNVHNVHWRGIERLPSGAGRYFAVSRDGGTMLVIVKMGSRNQTGGPMRSNRIGSHPGNIGPPSADKVVAVVPQDVGFNRAGGLQASGNLLAVGIEKGETSEVALFDVSDPEHPARVGTVSHRGGVKGAGTVALNRVQRGQFVLIVGDRDSDNLDFYLSSTTTYMPSPQTTWTRTATWNKRDVIKDTYAPDKKFGDYSSLELIGGRLIGMHTNGAGRDYADDFDLRGTAGDPEILKNGNVHLTCREFGDRQCSLDAAAGAYLTPDRDLLLYSTEATSDGAFVRAVEFHHEPLWSTCSTSDHAFITLFDDLGFEDRDDTITYADFTGGVDDLNAVSGFNDKASSAIWCLPRGATVRLYEDRKPCGGRHRDLVGVGREQVDGDFKKSQYFDGFQDIGDFNDDASCVKWMNLLPPAVTITPTPSPSPAPSPTPTVAPDQRPDLVFSATSRGGFTVKNQGRTAAGAFKVGVQNGGSFSFSGLAAGAEASKTFTSAACLDTRTFTVDVDHTVAESDETNNVSIYPEHCAADPGPNP